MSKRKSLLGMSAMLAALFADGGYRQTAKLKETDEQRQSRLTKAEIERNRRRGLTEFFYGEKTLWALNQKSADRKARRRNWI